MQLPIAASCAPFRMSARSKLRGAGPVEGDGGGRVQAAVSAASARAGIRKAVASRVMGDGNACAFSAPHYHGEATHAGTSFLSRRFRRAAKIFNPVSEMFPDG